MIVSTSRIEIASYVLSRVYYALKQFGNYLKQYYPDITDNEWKSEKSKDTIHNKIIHISSY